MRLLRVGAFLALAVIFVGVGTATTSLHGPTLRIVVRGSGQVTCGTRCPGTHGRGEILRLIAKPAPNYEFERWSGGVHRPGRDLSGRAGQQHVRTRDLRRPADRGGGRGRRARMDREHSHRARLRRRRLHLFVDGPVCLQRDARSDTARQRSIRRLGRAMRFSRLRRVHAPDRRFSDRDGSRLRAQLAAARKPAADRRPLRRSGAGDESADGNRLPADLHGTVCVGDPRHTPPEHRPVAARVYGRGARSVRGRRRRADRGRGRSTGTAARPRTSPRDSDPARRVGGRARHLE